MRNEQMKNSARSCFLCENCPWRGLAHTKACLPTQGDALFRCGLAHAKDNFDPDFWKPILGNLMTPKLILVSNQHTKCPNGLGNSSNQFRISQNTLES